MEGSALDALGLPQRPPPQLVVEPEEDIGNDPYILVQGVEDFRKYLKETVAEGPAVGLDTETNGLDTRIAKLVGISFSVREGTGVYIPIGHKVGTNVPQEPVIKLLATYLAETKLIPVCYNAKFDIQVLLTNTGWAPAYYEDAMNLVFLEDPDRREKDLKTICREDCGFVMQEFTSLFTPEERKAKVFDLSTKSPRRVKKYAAEDADGVLRVYKLKKKIKDEFKFPYTIDTLLVDVIREVEHEGGLEVNMKYVAEQQQKLKDLAKVLRDMTFAIVGRTFEIESPKQLGDALFGTLGLKSVGQTAKGWHKTGEKDLERLAETTPVVRYVLLYKKVIKAIGSYFDKLEHLHTTGVPVRFSFNQFAAPTYRLAAPGGSPEKDGKTGINIQAVSNGLAEDLPGVLLDQQERVAVKDYKAGLAEDELFTAAAPVPMVGVNGNQVVKDTVHPMLDLPWILKQENTETPVCVLNTCTGCPRACVERGLDVTRRMVKNVLVIPSVRQAFQAPKGYLLMACDYDRQEIVIGANLSGEPAWIAALKNGIDLHAQTAALAHNMTLQSFEALQKDDQKRKRDIGKTLNFATFYGATAKTLSRNTGITQANADLIYENNKRRHPTLFGWMKKMHLYSRQNGFVNTFFGRRRWTKKFYDTNEYNDGGGFGDRSSVNTPIQGTGADVIRIAMVKTVKWIREQGYTREQVGLVMSVHDELMFRIREDLVNEIGPHIVRLMMFHVKGWEIQLTVSPKVGKIWGKLKEYVFPKVANEPPNQKAT